MDPEETIRALLSNNEQLRQQNDHLRSMLSVYKENIDLRARMQSFSSSTLDELPVCSPSGRKPASLWQPTIDETHFRKDLQETRFQREHRTSSPVDFKAFVQNSVHADTSEKEESQSLSDLSLEGKHRLLGEIAYQLDGRILSHVFQGHKRLYGFTLVNIPDKIIEVSTHPLTGQVDDGYRFHLTQRYTELMEQLKQLGYKITLHPHFTEFIVNTYGILKERPAENSTQARDYNNSEYLRNLIVTTAPRKLKKDLLLVLTCLCHVAKRDRKPILLSK